MRTIRYQQIAAELQARLAHIGPGHVLPGEIELSREFAVSRVTVRKALEVLRVRGLVESRQGFGWYVVGVPVPQRLDELGTIEGQMEARGMRSERKVLEFAVEPAPPRVAETLGTDQVLRVRRLNLGDGEPFGLVTVWCPAELGRHLSRHDVEQHSFYRLLKVPLQGATQTIGADGADADEAATLQIAAGSPVLRCERITYGPEHRAVLMSEHVFPAHRTEFVVDLPYGPPTTAPAGLRVLPTSAEAR